MIIPFVNFAPKVHAFVQQGFTKNIEIKVSEDVGDENWFSPHLFLCLTA